MVLLDAADVKPMSILISSFLREVGSQLAISVCFKTMFHPFISAH